MSGPRDSVREFGRSLFEALLPAEVRTCYRTSLSTARTHGKGLRIRLRLDAPALALLPWEYLYDEVEREYVCLAKETPLIRYLEMPRSSEPLKISPPLRILAMVADPSDLPRLDVKKEKEQMAEAIHSLNERGQVKLIWLEGQTWRALQQAMRKGPWHVFHFIGHGSFDSDIAEGQLALADEQGKTHLLGATQLARLIGDHKSLKLVVLNSCEGATSSGADIFSSTGAALTGRGIPAVISMQDAITDRSALEFSRMFYEAVSEGLPVDSAVTEARIAMSMTVRDSLEWALPCCKCARATDACSRSTRPARSSLLGRNLLLLAPCHSHPWPPSLPGSRRASRSCSAR
jgi:CHAT domain-containing protein